MPKAPSQDNKLCLDADPEPFLLAAGRGRVGGKRKGSWWPPAWHSPAMACGQEGTEFCQYMNITTIACFGLYLDKSQPRCFLHLKFP